MVATEQRRTEETLDAWAQHWSSHDIDALLSLFTDDCVYEDVALGVVNRGEGELRAFFNAVFAAFPDFHIELTNRFSAGDRAAMEWRWSGTHKGEFAHHPATGKPASGRGASILEMSDGKIRRNTDYWNMTKLLEQLGPG